MGAVEDKNVTLANLLKRVREDFPTLKFRASKRFSYRFPRTINFEYESYRAELQLLHELGHALLLHKDFTTDPERLKMEREAWEKARELAEQYNIYYDEEFVEEELDSYRDWLHQRSRCKECGLTRYQTKDGVYHCPNCEVVDK